MGVQHSCSPEMRRASARRPGSGGHAAPPSLMFAVKFTSCDVRVAKHHGIATILQPCIPALCRTDASIAPAHRHVDALGFRCLHCAKHSSSRSAERTFFKNEDTFSQVILFTNPSSNTSNYEICRVLQ